MYKPTDFEWLERDDINTMTKYQDDHLKKFDELTDERKSEAIEWVKKLNRKQIGKCCGYVAIGSMATLLLVDGAIKLTKIIYKRKNIKKSKHSK